MKEDSFSQLKFHPENPGPIAPPLNQMSLNSLKADMRSLFDAEVIMHQRKLKGCSVLA
jgi:hypothetical protein